MKRCAIYARVSDESQAKGDSIQHQIQFCKEIAKRRSTEDGEEWMVLDELVYVDEAITGTSMVKRPEVQCLIRDARDHQFDVVLFKGISRFARDTVDALIMLRTLTASRVRVLSLEENFDSHRDNAEFVFTIHSALAQAESEKTAVRVRMGATQKAKAGKWNGKPPDGYLLNQETQHLEIDTVRAHVVQQIFDLYLCGYSARAIVKLLNHRGERTKSGSCWNARTVTRILQNPAYVGDVLYGRRERTIAPPRDNTDILERRKVSRQVTNPEQLVRVENAHPSLIDRDRFETVSAMLAERRAVRGRSGGLHLLSRGILFCQCGSRMVVKYNSRGTRYYQCARQNVFGKSDCTQPFLRADEVEKLVLSQLRQDLFGNQLDRRAKSFREERKSQVKSRGDADRSLREAVLQLLSVPPGFPQNGATGRLRIVRALLETCIDKVKADGHNLSISYRFEQPVQEHLLHDDDNRTTDGHRTI